MKAVNLTWVHSLADYCSMFRLDDQDLKASILDFPGRIASFTAEMAALSHLNVVSVDRHYDLSPLDMVKHVDFCIQGLAESILQAKDQLHPQVVAERDQQVNSANYVAQLFLNDYSVGQEAGRYQAAKLPCLPFAKAQFDLALCSHLVFRTPFFSAQEIVSELMRVAKEARIFPLLNTQGELAEELGPLMLELQQLDYGLEIKEVDYPFYEKNNAMLRIWAKACPVG